MIANILFNYNIKGIKLKKYKIQNRTLMLFDFTVNSFNMVITQTPVIHRCHFTLDLPDKRW